jgi:hypothetical protein
VPDAKLDLEELDLDANLDENDEKPLDSDENPKMLLEDIDLPLDILARVSICRLFRPFCSLLACSRRVGDDESGSESGLQNVRGQVREREVGTAKARTTTTTTSKPNQNQFRVTESIAIRS